MLLRLFCLCSVLTQRVESLYRTTPRVDRPSNVEQFNISVQVSSGSTSSGDGQAPPPSAFLTNPVLKKKLSCGGDAFNFSVEFTRPFYGIIHTENVDAGRCVYVEGWREPRTHYDVVIPYNDCGSSTTKDGKIYQTTNTFLIQQNVKFIEVNDNAITVVCRRYAADPDVTSDLDGNAIDRASVELPVRDTIFEQFEVRGPSEEVITRQVNEVSDDVMRFGSRLAVGDDPDGPLPDEPVQLGERLTYAFYCHSANGSDSIDCAVGECVATDPSGARRVELSDENGCSRHPAVWSNFFVYERPLRGGLETAKVFLARLSAWSFPTSSHVLISCRARSCNDRCQEATCNESIGAINDDDQLRSVRITPGNESEVDDRSFVRSDDGSIFGAGRKFGTDRNTLQDDAVVSYKIDRSSSSPLSSSSYGERRRQCPPINHDTGQDLRQAEVIVEQTDQPWSTGEFDRLTVADRRSPQQQSNGNRSCVAMQVFIGLISCLLAVLGLMACVIAFLMWKLHKTAHALPSLRIRRGRL